MYLSSILVNNGRWVQAIYPVHCCVSSGFPDVRRAPRGTGTGFLYRVEPLPQGQAMITVQSCEEPDWDHAFQNTPERLVGVKVREFNTEFAEGRSARFRLVANPTRRQEKDGRRVGLVSEDEQREWIDRKAEAGGFRIAEVALSKQGFIKSYKRHGSAHMTFISVQFDGKLEVVDPDRFAATLVNGVGPAKGFGFGLLSVA